jgi:hypothetical protein
VSDTQFAQASPEQSNRAASASGSNVSVPAVVYGGFLSGKEKRACEVPIVTTKWRSPPNYLSPPTKGLARLRCPEQLASAVLVTWCSLRAEIERHI